MFELSGFLELCQCVTSNLVQLNIEPSFNLPVLFENSEQLRMPSSRLLLENTPAVLPVVDDTYQNIISEITAPRNTDVAPHRSRSRSSVIITSLNPEALIYQLETHQEPMFTYNDSDQISIEKLIEIFRDTTLHPNIQCMKLLMDCHMPRRIEDLAELLSVISQSQHVNQIYINNTTLWFASASASEKDAFFEALGPVALRAKLICDESELSRFMRAYPGREPNEQNLFQTLPKEVVESCSFFLREHSASERELSSHHIMTHFS